MSRLLATIVLLAPAGSATAQDFPKPTDAGRAACEKLLRRCLSAGGLKEARDSKTGTTSVVLDDPGKLKVAVVAHKDKLTPELRDALVARRPVQNTGEHVALVTLLEVVADIGHDERAAAFGALFQAMQAEQRRDPAAVDRFDQAAQRFEACGERVWQAACLESIGLIKGGQGQYAEARHYHEKTLEIRRATLGERHPKVALSLANIAIACAQQGDYPKALEYNNQALKIRREVLGDNDPEVASSYNTMANICYDQGEFRKALDWHAKAIAIRRAAFGERHAIVARSYGNIANVHAKLGNSAQAIEYHEKALEIDRGRAGGRNPDVARDLLNMASVYLEQAEYDKALALDQQALEIFRETLGPRHPSVAHAYGNTANVHYSLGEYPKALELDQKALEILRATLGEHHRDIATNYDNTANAHYGLGAYAKALEYHAKALEIRRAVLGEKHPLVAYSLGNIGNDHYGQGDYVKALEYHQRALDIERVHSGDRHLNVAIDYGNIANALSALGQYADALVCLRKVLDIHAAAGGERHPSVARAYSGIARLYRELGEPALALRDEQKALGIYRSTVGEQHPDVASCLVGIAYAYYDQGDMTSALESLEKAQRLRRARLGERHTDVASGYANFADVYRAQKNPERALLTLNRAMAALDWQPGSAPEPAPVPTAARLRPLPLTVSVLLGRGICREEIVGPSRAADLRAALRDYQSAADVLDHIRRRVMTTEMSKVQIGESAAELFPRMVGAVARLAEMEPDPETLARAFDGSERGKARVFVEALGQVRCRELGRLPQALVDEEDRLLVELDRLDIRIGREQDKPLDRRDQDAVARLLEERRRTDEDLERFVRSLEREHPRYAALKYPKPCTLAEAQACLADDEVALNYVLGGKRSYLVVVPKVGKPTVHALAPAGEIGDLVAALRQPKILDDADATRELGKRAYATLLAAAAEQIRDKHLVIVAGGALGHLPFGLLIESEDGAQRSRWLVEGHRIRYAPSMTALQFVDRWERARAKPDRDLWALGDPVYEQTDARLIVDSGRTLSAETIHEVAQLRGDESASGFARLPQSGVEVERLQQIMGGSPAETLVGPAATEAALKRLSADGALARYRFVHFACHGVLGLADGTQPALVLTLVGRPGDEDGLLRLDEVTRLRLNADLVVLSACQSGEGRTYHAEGVSGLARAFLYAGSRGVVCSLWQVADRETSELMVDFYTGLKQHEPAAAALRDAQLRMIARGEPPRDWAPFILIGR